MKNTNVKRYEADLYRPIQKHFSALGYEVYGEVHDCDVVAVKEEELIIVELKLNLTVELLVQAAKRQKLSDQVYIAIPKPKYRLRSKKWNDISHLIRRLELGLIIVSFQAGSARMETLIEPGAFDRKKSIRLNKKRKDRMLSEISGRNGDYNVGGVTQTKIMTAYKENCIHIACCLKRFGPLSPKKLREMGTGDKTQSILHKNYYSWFERVSRGTYSLTPKGRKELESHPDVAGYYSEGLSLISEERPDLP
jgi:hypothetical protein